MSTASPTKIYSFGTSGYRNDTDEGFSEAVVTQITQAIGDYLIALVEKTGKAMPLLIGGDTRDKTRKFIPVIVNILLSKGIDVYQTDGDIPTPVLAYAAKYFEDFAKKTPGLTYPYTETGGAILMTASHNPWAYGGFNFLTPDAAVAPTEVTKAFETYQQAPKGLKLDRVKYGLPEKATVQVFDPYSLFQAHLKSGIKIDFAAIKASGVSIFYDPLYATGRKYFSRLLADEGIQIHSIHDTDIRPDGYTGMPEPTGSNLNELSALVAKSTDKLKMGLANDGDSDRFGVLDETGKYIIPNDVLALTLHHMIQNRGNKSGTVVRSQASTHLLDALAQKAGMSVVQTPVGYKYIAEEFIERENSNAPVIIGGESSGGLSVGGHIPEKDGLLANLLMAELVAVEKKPLGQILADLKCSLPIQFVSRELSITTEHKSAILDLFRELRNKGGDLGGFAIDQLTSEEVAKDLKTHYGTEDGVKLYLKDGSWVLIRTSGTEPIARVYIETLAPTTTISQEYNDKLDVAVREKLLSVGVDASQIKEKK